MAANCDTVKSTHFQIAKTFKTNNDIMSKHNFAILLYSV